MYHNELNTFIHAVVQGTMPKNELLARLVDTIDCTAVYESENQLTSDAFFALMHYATGEEHIKPIEWAYFIDCFEGRCVYNLEQKKKLLIGKC